MSQAKTRCSEEQLAFAIDSEAAAAKSRLVHLSLLNLHLRFMENWRSAQIHSAGVVLDHDTLLVMMAMIVIAAERVLRDELDPEFQCLAQQLPKSKLGKVNLSSIAAATGINRETVRRKVGALQEAGWVVRDKGGVRPVPGVLPADTLRNIIDAQVDALTRVVNQFAKWRVLSAG